jgi:hypothetical protein
MGMLAGAKSAIALRAGRLMLIVVGLLGWFWTQWILGRREWPAGRIRDRLHEWTARRNRYPHEHPRATNRLLIASSAISDARGLSSFLPRSRRPKG